MLGFSTFSFCLLILKFELLTCGARRMPFQPSTFSLSEDVFITQFVTLRNWQSCLLSAEASQVCVLSKNGQSSKLFLFFFPPNSSHCCFCYCLCLQVNCNTFFSAGSDWVVLLSEKKQEKWDWNWKQFPNKTRTDVQRYSGSPLHLFTLGFCIRVTQLVVHRHPSLFCQMQEIGI